MTGAVPERCPAQATLVAIPGMANAKLLGRLSDGPTNTSFRAERGDEQFVLRLDKPGAVSLGLNRRNEYRVCEIVSAAGIGPEPVYSDPGRGVYLRRYLPGQCWTGSDVENPCKLERLAGLLARLHGLPPQGDTFDPLAAARRYAGQIDSAESRATLAAAERLMRKISEGSHAQALCHNDLLCQNILEREPLILIDWEYAGVGDPFFDLAVVVQHHELDNALANGFLDEYLGRPAGDREKQHLALQCEFYACLLQLWICRSGFIREFF